MHRGEFGSKQKAFCDTTRAVVCGNEPDKAAHLGEKVGRRGKRARRDMQAEPRSALPPPLLLLVSFDVNATAGQYIQAHRGQRARPPHPLPRLATADKSNAKF